MLNNSSCKLYRIESGDRLERLIAGDQIIVRSVEVKQLEDRYDPVVIIHADSIVKGVISFE